VISLHSDYWSEKLGKVRELQSDKGKVRKVYMIPGK